MRKKTEQKDYTNNNPPYLDKQWKFTGSLDTDIMQTWVKFGFKYTPHKGSK